MPTDSLAAPTTVDARDLPDVDQVARRAFASMERHIASTTDYERLLTRIQTSADRRAGECPDAHDSY